MKAEPLLPRLPQLLCQRCAQRACPQHRPCTPKGKGDRTRIFFQAPWLPLPQTISQVRPHFQHSFNELGNKCSSCPLPPLSQDWRAWAATPGAAALCCPVTARLHAPHWPRQSRHARASVWQAQMSPTFLRTQDDPVLIPTSQELAFFPAEDGELGVPCLHVRSFSKRPQTTCPICRPARGQPPLLQYHGLASPVQGRGDGLEQPLSGPCQHSERAPSWPSGNPLTATRSEVPTIPIYVAAFPAGQGRAQAPLRLHQPWPCLSLHPPGRADPRRSRGSCPQPHASRCPCQGHARHRSRRVLKLQGRISSSGKLLCSLGSISDGNGLLCAPSN